MFLKLLKNEFKITYKSFLVILILNFISCLLGRRFENNYDIKGFFIFAWSISLLCIMFYSIYAVIRICGVSLYGKRGYLIYSLPIEPYKIILSKVVAAFVYGIISILCIAFSIYVLFGADLLIIFKLNGPEAVAFWLNVIDFAFGYFDIIILIICCSVFSNISFGKKTSKAMYVIPLILIISFYSAITSFDKMPYLCYDSLKNAYVIMPYEKFGRFEENIEPIFNFIKFIIDVVAAFGLYFLTIYMINHKLEVQ